MISTVDIVAEQARFPEVFRGKGWDTAYETAVGEAKRHFRACQRCGHWVCPDRCWNGKAGLCTACAPDLRGEAVVIQAQVAVEQLREKARQADQTAGTVSLPEGIAMCLPGDNVSITVELLDGKPIAMDADLRFAIREGSRTIGSGKVTKILG